MGASKQLQLILLLPQALASVVFSGMMMEATSFSMAASGSRDNPSGLNELPIRKRVLVVGSGAVGCLYGGRLKESGHDVTFMMRRELEAVRQKGLKVKSPDGDMVFPPEDVKVVGSAAEYEATSKLPADWVIFTLKSTSFNEIPNLLGENVVGPNTRLLLVMNGLGLEADLVRLCGVKEERVFGGMAFVCANRGSPGSGEVAHLGYGKLMIGHKKDDPQELAEARQLWQEAKIPVETADDLLKARYEKLCWNIPFNGLGVLLGGVDTQNIVSTPELRTLASRAMYDVITLANADLHGRKDRAATIPREQMHDLMFELTDRMGPYMSSTVLDLLGNKQLETEYMFNRPLARAIELNVSVPYLEFVCRGVEGLRRMKGL